MIDGPKSLLLRHLSEEEIELWLGVTMGIARRAGSTLPERLAEPEPAIVAKPIVAAPVSRPAPLPKKIAAMAPLERKLKQKLSRGKMAADAAIDLHGLRQAEAYAALLRFLHRARRDGARVVLVVTGKGGRHADGFDMAGGEIGVLKRSVPLWLALPEFRALVVGCEEAGRPHGGAGALYVRLRRREQGGASGV